MAQSDMPCHIMPRPSAPSQPPTILPDSGDVSHHPFQGEIDHFIECIQNDVESHANVADAYKTHENIIAADLSGQEGLPVQLPFP